MSLCVMCITILAACETVSPKLTVACEDSYKPFAGEPDDNILAHLNVTYVNEKGKECVLSADEFEFSIEFTETECIVTVFYGDLQSTVSLELASAPHEHSYTLWKHTDAEHWKECEADGNIDETSREKHSFDSDGKCVCGYIETPSPVPAKGTAENPYTVGEAIKFIDSDGGDEAVYVRGQVTHIYDSGAFWFTIASYDGAIAVLGAQFADGVGDIYIGCSVDVCGVLSYESGIVDVSYIMYSAVKPSTVEQIYAPGSMQNPLSPTSALREIERLGYNTYSEQPVYVSGFISGDILSGQTHGYRFEIEDFSNTLTIYYADLSSDDVDELKLGDLVTVRGYLYNYLYDSDSVPIPELKANADEECEVTAVARYASALTARVEAYANSINVGEQLAFEISTIPKGFESHVVLEFQNGADCGTLSGNVFYAVKEGYVSLKVMLDGKWENTVVFEVEGYDEKDVYTVSEVLSATERLDYNAYSDTPVRVYGQIVGDIIAGTTSGFRFEITDGDSFFTIYYAELSESVAPLLKPGDWVTVYGYLYNYRYNEGSAPVPEMKSYGDAICRVEEVDACYVEINPYGTFYSCGYGESVTIQFETDPYGYEQYVSLRIVSGNDNMCSVSGFAITPKQNTSFGVTVVLYIDEELVSEDIVIEFYFRSDGTRNNPYSVAEAYEIASAMTQEYSDDPVYVKGVVSGSVTSTMDYTFGITDSSGYMFKVINAKLQYSSDEQRTPSDGDVVVVYGCLYNGTDVGLRSHNDYKCAVVELIGGTVKPDISISISVASNKIFVGDEVEISVKTLPSGYENEVELSVLQGNQYGYIYGVTLYALQPGEIVLQAILHLDGSVYQSQLTLQIERKPDENITIVLKAEKYLIEYSDNTYISATVVPQEYTSQLVFEITDGKNVASLVGSNYDGKSLLPSDAGYVTVEAYIGTCRSNPVTIQIIRYDPYTNMGASGFYNNNYKPAEDLEDSYWRTKHNLMSGDISEQDQAPDLSPVRPTSDNKFVRNTDENFADNGNSYKVVDYQGNVVNTIYKCGAYVTLEEVAAYVYAFGTIPANYVNSNKTSSLKGNAWGKYLRLNHSKFSGDTYNYPYEPVLPNISGCGGTYQYYEIDIGTTGTDCDPAYDAVPYNDGNRITRGAARIVYAETEYGVSLSPSERYVFYTYNHYNDFQEYLNYSGGWGEMFGNITGGGTISSKYDCNPTPYVETARDSFGIRNR